MSDKIINGYIKTNGVIGKIIYAFFMITLIALAALIYQGNIQSERTLKQNEKMIEQLALQNSYVEKLIEAQAEIKSFKKCIKKAYDFAMKEFNDEFIIKLGKLLKNNNVVFPDDLNESINKFRTKAEYIKNCLIFPEEVE